MVDHLFRHQAGRLVSTLTRIFGPRQVELAEEVVQEALVKALELWPFEGIPANPGGWLMQVARNRALDAVRRESLLLGKLPEIERSFRSSSPLADADERAFEDDQLSMIFLCCHPALTRETRIALTLKTVGGFSVAEIARAFLTQAATVAQRIVRAKRQIRDESLRFEMPVGSDLAERLESVLDVLHLMFNEGYAAHSGEDLIRADLCDEAIRLARLVIEHAECDSPEVHALLALMLLQHARQPARTDAAGELWVLSEQDRSLWNQRMIRQGLVRLGRSAAGSTVSVFHLQAGIAAAHAVSPTYADTDWAHIADLYDQLYDIDPTPVVALNRAVARSRHLGPLAGIEDLQRIESHPALSRYHLLHAVLAELWREAGDPDKAAAYYRAALQCECSEPERRLLTTRLEHIDRASLS